VNQAIEGLCPLIEIFVAFHEEPANLFEEFRRLDFMLMHVYQNVALDDLEWVVERMRISLCNLVHFLSDDSRLRSIYNCDDLIDPSEEDPCWGVLRTLLELFFNYLRSSLAYDIQQSRNHVTCSEVPKIYRLETVLHRHSC